MIDGEFSFDVAQICARGGREENEDSIRCEKSENRLMAAVADGLGGQGGGALASARVLECLKDLAHGEEVIGEERLASLCTQANAAIIALQKQYGVNMMSTLVLLALAPRQYWVAHVGDSRCYVFRKDEIVFQTLDHSLPQLDVQAGVITAEQIRFHSERNKLLRAIGGRQTVRPDVVSGVPQTGDAFLLCSDGFWEQVTETEMCEDLRASDGAQAWLTKMLMRVQTRLTDQADNLSAIAIWIKQA